MKAPKDDPWLTIAQVVPVEAHTFVRQQLDRVAAEKSITREHLIRKHIFQAQVYRQRQELDRARHEEGEARLWESCHQRLPYRRIPQLRILCVWFLLCGERGLEPKQARPFYAAAHEYVFGTRAPKGDARAFRRLLQEFRKLIVDDLKRRPVRFITPFGTEVR